MATQPNHLNMMEGSVNNLEGHTCGTVHCVGGWYAIATIDLSKRVVDYHDGGHEMAKHLGFSDRDKLIDWAHSNRDIWGNSNGSGMFCDEDAYDSSKTLADVIIHLEGVRDRSPE